MSLIMRAALFQEMRSEHSQPCPSMSLVNPVHEPLIAIWPVQTLTKAQRNTSEKGKLTSYKHEVRLHSTILIYFTTRRKPSPSKICQFLLRTSPLIRSGTYGMYAASSSALQGRSRLEHTDQTISASIMRSARARAIIQLCQNFLCKGRLTMLPKSTLRL